MPRKILITGASGGLGHAIAERFAEAGETLILHAFSRDDVLQTLKKKHPQADIHIVPCDLTEPNASDVLAECAWNWRDGLDVLIQTAGVDILTGVRKTWTFAQKLEALWRLDVQAGVRLARNIGEKMHNTRGGVILNVGWDATEFGMAGDSAELFAIAKGAMTAFSRCLAASLAPNVRVNVLAPGFIQTAWGENASEHWQDRAKNCALLGRWGVPTDVAEAAFFLASENAAFLNGLVLPINGGRAAR